MKRFILAAAACAALMNVNAPRAIAEEMRDLTATKQVVTEVERSISERATAIETEMNLRKERISGLEAQLGNMDHEVRLGAQARAEIYKQLEIDHAAAEDARAQLQTLRACQQKAHRAAANYRRTTRRQLVDLVTEVKRLGGLDAQRAELLGKLLGRVAEQEGATKRLDGRTTALERRTTIVENGVVHATVAGEEATARVDLVEKRVNHLEAANLDMTMFFFGGLTSGVATNGGTFGAELRLQRHTAPWGLAFAISGDTGKMADTTKLVAFRFDSRVLIGSEGQLFVPLFGLTVGAAATSDAALTDGMGAFVSPSIGAEVRLPWTRLVTLSASIGPIFGKFEGWEGTVRLGVDMFALIGGANAPVTAPVVHEERL